jgi:hypothetical protein
MANASFAASLAIVQALVWGGALGAAQANATETGSTDRITVRLAASRYNSGESGMAVLVPAGSETMMTIQISGVPDYTSRPIHLTAEVFGGGCGSRSQEAIYAPSGPILAHSLIRPAAIGALRGPSRIAHRLPVQFEELRTTPFAISVRLRPADGNHEIFCGDRAT